MNRKGRFRGLLGSLFTGGGQGADPNQVSEEGAPTLVPFDPLDRAFVADPYPYLAELQDRDPVHRSENGAWVLTRYEDVVAALADRRLGNAPSMYAVVNKRNRERYPCADVANNIIPFLDPPGHLRPRRIIARAFAGFLNQPNLNCQGLAADYLKELELSGGDALHHFATPYALRVISTILGVPSQDEQLLKQWSESFFYLFSIIPSEEIRSKLDADLESFRAYFRELAGERRRHPRNDLISTLLHAELDGERLTEAELVDNCMLLFADGVENVDSGIASGLYALLSNPDQLTLLRARPDLVKQAVEECLRFEAPGQFIGRVVLEDFELHGVSLKKNVGVLLLIGAANRDPRRFDNPHRFDLLRSPNPHLSFGKGLHACIGAPLVRLQLAAVLRALLECPANVALGPSPVQWEARLGHRWLAGLPVEFARG